LKSKSLRIFNYCMLFLFCGIIDALFPSSHYLSSKGAT
jgi:hypothetical protein